MYKAAWSTVFALSVSKF